MKTKIYLTTMLAVLITIMAYSQSQPLAYEPAGGRIRATLGGEKAATPGSSDAGDMKAMESEIVRMTKSLSELETASYKLRNESLNKQPAEREKLLADALRVENQAMLLQLDALEKSGIVNNWKFNKNRSVLRMLLSAFKGDDSLMEMGTYLSDNSEMNMKMAREMREEANAQMSLAARVGNMSNAEEKELLALDQQTRAIGILDKSGTPKGQVY